MSYDWPRASSPRNATEPIEGRSGREPLMKKFKKIKPLKLKRSDNNIWNVQEVDNVRKSMQEELEQIDLILKNNLFDLGEKTSYDNKCDCCGIPLGFQDNLANKEEATRHQFDMAKTMFWPQLKITYKLNIEIIDLTED